MDFLQAFPVAIIDEDYDGPRAAGRGMRQLAAAIEKEGFRSLRASATTTHGAL
jgi:arginine decarboxylase